MSLEKGAALPAAAAAPAYTDLAGLGSLKRGAASHDPTAIRRVAQEFESMFTRMMLKSMRDAVGPDPMFGSDQEQMYQSMADDQLSVQLSRGRGLGLADMLIRQLQKLGVPGAAAASPGSAANPAAAGARMGTAAYSAVQRVGTTPSPATGAQQGSFVQQLWPHAQQAGEELGVDPRSLIAQAALETNWGRNIPQGTGGASSHNLFGLKATDWRGASVTAATQEYRGGTPTSTTAQFRAYASPAESFQDYVALLRDNPRYAGALNTGGNVEAFAAGLQQGGYATDPDYVRKVSAIAASVAGTLSGSGSVSQLKSADARPINANTGTL
ncbi:MAG TPA: flagellar assembly peptidoglycan hydrolase FlgJ [Steroidobacteraceae bacterium]|jgi:flagellar protein FlgJ